MQNGYVIITTYEYIFNAEYKYYISKNKGRPEKNLVNEQDIPLDRLQQILKIE